MTESPICLDFYPRSQRWVLREPYVRETSLGTILVPAGFETDLASTPWQVWKRYPKLGPWTGPAIIHDWLYRQTAHNITREQADKVFLELLLRDGVPIVQARSMYYIVRRLGGSAWTV